MNRVRGLIQRIVFAGMKPGGYADPLYLSNRTIGWKIMAWSAVTMPFVLIITVICLATNGQFVPPPPQEPLAPAAVKTPERMLPEIGALQIDTIPEVTVLDFHVNRGPAASIDGTLKNTTRRAVRSAEVMFDVTGSDGSQLGAVSLRVGNLGPQATTKFHLPLRQSKAAFAVVREVHAK